MNSELPSAIANFDNIENIDKLDKYFWQVLNSRLFPKRIDNGDDGGEFLPFLAGCCSVFTPTECEFVYFHCQVFVALSVRPRQRQPQIFILLENHSGHPVLHLLKFPELKI